MEDRKGGGRPLGFIHNPNKKEINAERGLDLIRFHDVSYLYSFLAHQYTIRRLALKYPDQYKILLEFRRQLCMVLDKTVLTNAPAFFRGSKITALACCMNFFESEGNRLLGGQKHKIKEIVIDKLRKHDEYGYGFRAVLGYISDEQIEDLAESIAHFSSGISDFYNDYNFTDYFSIFSLSNFVSGETLIKHYLATKSKKHTMKVYADLGCEDLQWLRTKEAEEDDELCGITLLNCCAIKKLVSNVLIFGHDQHEIKINDHVLKKHLLLAVPLDKTPENIDHAIRMFRLALKEAFIDVNGSYAAISAPAFESSLFMTSYEDRPLFKEDMKQFRSKIHGLWGWDLSNGLGMDPVEKMTVSRMCEAIITKEGSIKADLGLSESCYAYESNKNNYDQAVKIIGHRASDDTQTSLDQYITRGSVTLGKRKAC